MTKKNKSQDLIVHEFNGVHFHQRQTDGYYDATSMCKIYNKQFSDYLRLKDTQELIEEIEGSMGIPRDLLIIINTKGKNTERGSFVHPLLANDVARWCDKKFAIKVLMLTETWKQGKLTYTPKPQKPEKTPEYLAISEKAKQTRKTLTQAMKDCGKNGLQIIGLTDQIYRGLFGASAKELRKQRNIPEKASIREYLEINERIFVDMMEQKASDLLLCEYNQTGFVSSGDVGRTVKQLCDLFSQQIKALQKAPLVKKIS